MIWIVTLIAAAVLLILVYPILGPRPSWDLDESPERLLQLKRARERVLRTLKDLEIEHRQGSLVTEEYERLRQRFKRDAIELTREFQRVREAAVRRVLDGPATGLGEEEARKLEELVDKRKARLRRAG